jgi:hypothetical protein
MKRKSPVALHPPELLLLCVLLVGLRASPADPGSGTADPHGVDPKVEVVYLHVPALTREAVNLQIRSLQAAGEARWVEELYSQVAGSKELAAEIIAQALAGGVPVNLVFAIIQEESQFRPWARGLDGEIGLMQLLPSTFAAVIDKHGEGHLWGVENNLRWGLRYLDSLYDQADGWDQAVSHYNGRGEAALSYLLEVQRYEKQLDSMFNAALDLYLRGGSRYQLPGLVASGAGEDL